MPGSRPIERVLIVDDEPEILSLLADYLSSLGYDPVVYAAAKEALDEFRAGFFDVLITDLRMPGLKGLDLMAALRERDPALAMVIITGTPGELEAGVPPDVEVIEKPIALDRLRAAVRSGVAKTHAARQRERPS